MDTLPSDIVEHIVDLLPYHTFQKLTSAAAQNDNWMFALNGHEKNRYKLVVDVLLPRDDEEEIRFSVSKFENGSSAPEEYDFKQRHYARLWFLSFDGLRMGLSSPSVALVEKPWVLLLPTHHQPLGIGSALHISNIRKENYAELLAALKGVPRTFDTLELRSIIGLQKTLMCLLTEFAEQGNLQKLTISGCSLWDNMMQPLATMWARKNEGNVHYAVRHSFGFRAVCSLIQRWQSGDGEWSMEREKLFELGIREAAWKDLQKVRKWVEDDNIIRVHHTTAPSSLVIRRRYSSSKIFYMSIVRRK
ncbi:hypothetical protein QR680_009835 [Steinernema hermaphroditum]|uniref:F-box domain-containing protein n=1 Tax=Steinernema hermaphroditum TaxID=289476 RepID=A0AA39ILT5_9BILA|nr:hypothetical protein QR680_009835 [Steinernema hermaphroditum]